MAAGDASDFRAELRARAPEIVEVLLGAPTFRSRREWRWGRRCATQWLRAAPG